MIAVVVNESSGILEEVTLFEDEEQALQHGRREFGRMTGFSTMHEETDQMREKLAEAEPGYDPEWGGVSRGFIMHWWTDDIDIWVVEAKEPTSIYQHPDEELCPACAPGKEKE